MPTGRSSKTTRTGRGGAGNFTEPTPPEGPAERAKYRVPAGREVSVRSRRNTTSNAATTGRGGSGNKKRVTGKDQEGQGFLNLDPHEITVLKFNREATKEGNIRSGRGGVGNFKRSASSPDNSSHVNTLPNSAASNKSPHFAFIRRTSIALRSSSSFVLSSPPAQSLDLPNPSLSCASNTLVPSTISEATEGAGTPMSNTTSADVAFAPPHPSLYGTGTNSSRASPPETIQMSTFPSRRTNIPAFPEPHSEETPWGMPLSRKNTLSTYAHKQETSLSSISDWGVRVDSMAVDAPTFGTLSKEEKDIINVRRGFKMAQVFGQDRFHDLDGRQPLSHSRSTEFTGYYPRPNVGDSRRSEPIPIHPTSSLQSSNTRLCSPALAAPTSSKPTSTEPASAAPTDPRISVLPLTSSKAVLKAKEKKPTGVTMVGKIARFFKGGPTLKLDQPDWNDISDEDAQAVLARLRSL